MKLIHLSQATYRVLALAFLLTLNWTPTFAQIDCTPLVSFENGSFEDLTNCMDQFNTCFGRPFNEGCVDDWYAGHGTPNACWEFPEKPDIIPCDGRYMAGIATKGNPCRNESFFKQINFDLTKPYELSFCHRTATFSTVTEPIDVKVYLTKNLTPNTTDYSYKACSDLVLPPESELIYSFDNLLTSSWQTVSVSFNPIAGLDQLVFVAFPKTGNIGTQYWLLDNIVMEECEVPTICNVSTPSNLSCQYSNQLQLTWDPVPEATCYIVYIDPLHASCCTSQYTYPGFEINVAGNVTHLDVPNNTAGCFRWKVRACCPNGFSEWSPFRCQTENMLCAPGLQIPKLEVSKQQIEQIKGSTDVRIYPNPSASEFTFEVKTKLNSNLTLRITDATGKLIYFIEQTTDNGSTVERWLPSPELPNGLYILEARIGDQIINEKLVLQR